LASQSALQHGEPCQIPSHRSTVFQGRMAAGNEINFIQIEFLLCGTGD
jgi:hypothetical protein